MNIEDIMIGNYVTINCEDGSKINIKITYIDNVIVYGVSDEGSHWANITNITPIVINPEFLMNNGFIDNQNVYPYPYYEYKDKEALVKICYAFPDGKNTIYKMPFVEIDTAKSYIEHLECRYIHQLQQIMHLCRIKKEIQL